MRQDSTPELRALAKEQGTTENQLRQLLHMHPGAIVERVLVMALKSGDEKPWSRKQLNTACWIMRKSAGLHPSRRPVPWDREEPKKHKARVVRTHQATPEERERYGIT